MTWLRATAFLLALATAVTAQKREGDPLPAVQDAGQQAARQAREDYASRCRAEPTLWLLLQISEGRPLKPGGPAYYDMTWVNPNVRPGRVLFSWTSITNGATDDQLKPVIEALHLRDADDLRGLTFISPCVNSEDALSKLAEDVKAGKVAYSAGAPRGR